MLIAVFITEMVILHKYVYLFIYLFIIYVYFIIIFDQLFLTFNSLLRVGNQ